ARTIGVVSLVAALLGADLMCWLVYNVSLIRAAWWWIMRLRGLPIGTNGPALSWWGELLGTVFFFAGLGGLLLHATVEKEQQLRRAYGVLGSFWLVLGAVLLTFNIFGAQWAANYGVTGAGCVFLALLFLLAFVRNETDQEWHTLALNAVGIVGGVLAAGLALGAIVCLVLDLTHPGRNASTGFLLPDGVFLGLLSLAYLWAFVSVR